MTSPHHRPGIYLAALLCWSIGTTHVLGEELSATAKLIRVDQPLIKESDVDTGKARLVKEAREGVKNGRLTDDVRQTLDRFARVTVLGMTLKKNRHRLHEFRREIRQVIDVYRARNDNDDARNFLARRLVANAEKLLTNNLYVRINAVMLLSELREGRPHVLEQPLPYAASRTSLLRVLSDPAQPEVVKIPAIEGLAERCRADVLDLGDRRQMAFVVATELRRTNTHAPYQQSLVAALSTVNLVDDDDIEQQPVVFNVLLAVMRDPERHWRVRTKAARALGRLPLRTKNDEHLVCREIVALTSAVAAAVDQSIAEFKQGNTAVYWKECFLDLYLAFQPIDRYESERKAGLLTLPHDAPHVQSAYRVTLPVVRQVLKMGVMSSQISRDSIVALRDWREQYAAE